MLRIVCVAAYESLDHVPLPKSEPLLLPIGRGKCRQSGEGTFVAEIKVAARPQRPHGGRDVQLRDALFQGVFDTRGLRVSPHGFSRFAVAWEIGGDVFCFAYGQSPRPD